MDQSERHCVSHTPIQTFEVPTPYVTQGDRRLNASFYSPEAVAARRLLERFSEKGEVVALSELVGTPNIYMPALKIRIPFSDYGEPYLTQSEAQFFLPRPRKKVDTSKLAEPDKWRVQSGYLLVSQSGTIGRITMATKYIEGLVISPNPIRIVAQEPVRGYLYAFLSSWIGSALIRSSKYGVTVDHILPQHLYDLPIPRLPELETPLNDKVLQAHALRERSQDLVLQAEELIHSLLGLPKMDPEQAKFVLPNGRRVLKSFQARTSDLRLRFDVSYHLPIFREIQRNLDVSRFPQTKFGELTTSMFVPARFKRAYVKDPKAGVPFLQGSHIPQMKVVDVKYLWRKSKNIRDLLVRRDCILMTRSGTVGRVAIVRRAWAGWAASEHLLRITTRPEIHPGYITTFLTCPYGQHQIKRAICGAVVDEIAEQDTSLIEDIDIVLPPKDVRDAIGDLAVRACDGKDKATRIEREAVTQLESTLRSIAGGQE